jgi:hypothetical protein
MPSQATDNAKKNFFAVATLASYRNKGQQAPCSEPGQAPNLARADLRVFLDRLATLFACSWTDAAKHITASALVKTPRGMNLIIAKNEGCVEQDDFFANSLQAWLRKVARGVSTPADEFKVWARVVDYHRHSMRAYSRQTTQFSGPKISTLKHVCSITPSNRGYVDSCRALGLDEEQTTFAFKAHELRRPLNDSFLEKDIDSMRQQAMNSLGTYRAALHTLEDYVRGKKDFADLEIMCLGEPACLLLNVHGNDTAVRDLGCDHGLEAILPCGVREHLGSTSGNTSGSSSPDTSESTSPNTSQGNSSDTDGISSGNTSEEDIDKDSDWPFVSTKDHGKRRENRSRLMESVRLFQHAEIQILNHLLGPKFEGTCIDKYIGCNKRACYLCHKLLTKLGYATQGSHGIVFHYWHSGPMYNMSSEVRSGMVGIADELLAALVHQVNSKIFYPRQHHSQARHYVTPPSTPQLQQRPEPADNQDIVPDGVATVFGGLGITAAV